MRHLIVLITLLVTCFASANIGAGRPNYEHILRYHSDIVVQKNCDVIVTETIEVYAAGNQIQRGIYRDFPLSYLYKAANVHVGFELISLERDGHEEPFHTDNIKNGIRIFAGSKDYYLPEGIYTYKITYRLDHVLGFFKEYDEIYWNINGTGWAFPIDSISANVYYPEGATLVQFDGYTGAQGANGKNFVTKKIDGGVAYYGTYSLGAGENLTVAVAWDKDQLIYPTGWDEFIYWLQSYILWVIGVLGVLIGFFFNFRTWSKYGRDPKPGTIIPLFYAPKGFSPAECAYLKNEGRATDTLFGSTLMSLAVKGMLTIDVEKTGIVFKSKAYTITKLEENPENAKKPLNEIEESFFNSILGRKSSIVIQKGKYNAALNTAKTNLIANIDKKQKGKYYVRNAHLKARQFVFPLITGIAGGLAYYAYGGFIAVAISAVVLQTIMNIIFARLYEQPTKEGRKVMDEILGFAMYLKYADKQRIKLMNPPDMNFEHFEENLAYAIALDIAEEWAGQFDPKELEDFRNGRMPYYHGMAIGSFNDFSSDLTSTISSASTPPSSSGSGSGGGGFSGGGGGGGGGGGW